jgi:hypothetical protein
MSSNVVKKRPECRPTCRHEFADMSSENRPDVVRTATRIVPNLLFSRASLLLGAARMSSKVVKTAPTN